MADGLGRGPATLRSIRGEIARWVGEPVAGLDGSCKPNWVMVLTREG